MSALNPWFLLAAASVAVPLFLHLFHRRRTRRVSFPALRYLQRTEREHARRIRLRQILLLLVRVTALLLVVGAGARLVFFGRSEEHAPTAVVLILDNSMSSSRVMGERRVLDELRDMALRTLDVASAEDRIWVLRAGEPWQPAVAGDAAEARRLVEAAAPTAAAGDLDAALRRAAELLATAEHDAREIHLLSDLQASAFAQDATAPAGFHPVVVWGPEPDTATNHALVEVVVGRGLPPLAGQRPEITVRAAEAPAGAPELDVRVVVDGRVRGAAALPPGSEVTIPLPPSGTGWVSGFVETEPDDLRLDDRRYFAFHPRPAPTVAMGGSPGLFLGEAVAVLEEAGRLRRAAPTGAELLVAVGGAGLEQRGDSTAALVVPDVDPTLLPALNRRLADAGIPWRYEAGSGTGAVELAGVERVEALQSVRVERWFVPQAIGETPGGARVLARAGAAPWAVETVDATGRRVLLVASAFDEASTSLPTSTGLVRFLDWVTSEWAADVGPGTERAAGDPVPAPPEATHVRLPSGEVAEIDGTRTVRATGAAGHYTFLADDEVLQITSVNPPARESRLARLPEEAMQTAIGPEVEAPRPDRWERAIFRERRGPELWRPLLFVAFLLLLAESALAAAGRARPGRVAVPARTTTDVAH